MEHALKEIGFKLRKEGVEDFLIINGEQVGFMRIGWGDNASSYRREQITPVSHEWYEYAKRVISTPPKR